MISLVTRGFLDTPAGRLLTRGLIGSGVTLGSGPMEPCGTSADLDPPAMSGTSADLDPPAISGTSSSR